MQLYLPRSARVAALLIGVTLAALLFVPSLQSYRAHRLLGASEDHISWGRLEEARDALLRAATLTPLDAELCEALGNIERARTRWRGDPATRDRALAAYATATALNARDGSLFAGYAEALIGAERYAAAHEALSGALERDPNNAAYHALRGRLAEAEGQPEAALAAYRRAQTIKPNSQLEALIAALSAGGN
jgi:tetratricopeptide (TPR) repeat protein